MSPATRAHRTQPPPPPPAYSVLLAAAAVIEVKAEQQPALAHLTGALREALAETWGDMNAREESPR